MPSTRPVMAASLASPPAAARRLDRDDVAGGEVERDLGRHGLAVEEVASWRARRAAPLAPRCVCTTLADDRETAVFEHAQLAYDALTAAMPAGAAGAPSQPIALDPQRVLQLERLDRSRERVRHRDVHAARPVGIRARALSPADRLVLREP